MYKIIGVDEKEYGPITAEQMRQWLAEGRVNAQTKVQGPESSDWKTLADFPEFSPASPISSPPPPPPPLSAPASAPEKKTSGLAITSLVLGILGALTCGLTALFGLIVGIVALVKIKNSNGEKGGWGIALAGTIISGVFLLMLPLLAAMLLPALAKAKQRAQTISCVNNLKQLALAVRIYSGDNNDLLPPAETWCDAIGAETPAKRIFQCPAGEKNEQAHYAFNAKLGGLNETNAAPDTVMLFEVAGGWNVSGGSELMLPRSRHGRTYMIAFADGSVQQITESQLNTLRWDP